MAYELLITQKHMENWDWVDKAEAKMKEEKSKDYFNIEEGKQQFVLMSHFAPLAQVWDGSKYRIAVEGDEGISMRGVCWVLQDGAIKQAKMPYTIVKSVRALTDDPDWEFELPFPHVFTLTAIGAGTKEVKYSLTPSPKKITFSEETLTELKKKPTPEEMVEKMKGTVSQGKKDPFATTVEYPDADINPEDIPF